MEILLGLLLLLNLNAVALRGIAPLISAPRLERTYEAPLQQVAVKQEVANPPTKQLRPALVLNVRNTEQLFIPEYAGVRPFLRAPPSIT